jgi:hypothetical protein
VECAEGWPHPRIWKMGVGMWKPVDVESHAQWTPHHTLTYQKYIKEVSRNKLRRFSFTFLLLTNIENNFSVRGKYNRTLVEEKKGPGF